MLDRAHAPSSPVHGREVGKEELLDSEGYTMEHATYVTRAGRIKMGRERERCKWSEGEEIGKEFADVV